MNILLVEDETPKAEKITSCIREAIELSNISLAKSVSSAISCIHQQSFDLIILDMSLPTFEITNDEYGGKPQGFGGKEVLRELQNYEFDIPVIVMTAYEAFPSENGKVKVQSFLEVKSELEIEYPEFFLGMIKYETIFDEWRQNLIKLIIRRVPE